MIEKTGWCDLSKTSLIGKGRGVSATLPWEENEEYPKKIHLSDILTIFLFLQWLKYTLKQFAKDRPRWQGLRRFCAITMGRKREYPQKIRLSDMMTISLFLQWLKHTFKQLVKDLSRCQGLRRFCDLNKERQGRVPIENSPVRHIDHIPSRLNRGSEPGFAGDGLERKPMSKPWKLIFHTR